MGGVINIITRKVPERLSASVMLGGIVQEDGRYGNSTLGNFWIGAPITSDTVGVQIYGGLNDRAEDDIRSEEHTSELQSLMRISYAVFCLKKKKHNII